MTDKQTQLHEVRTSALFDAVSEQRNSALNALANAQAENAVLRSVVNNQAGQIADLEKQLAEARVALQNKT